MAKDASVILDIGAHNGSYSLEAKLANPAARVIAIEPNSNIAERAAANFRLNKFDVELENVAAGREESVLAFNGWSFLHQVGKNEVKTEIRVRRVSDLLAEKNIHHLGLLKIDIEGYEPEAFRGMLDVLERCRPSIILEVNSEEEARNVRAVLGHIHYQYFQIEPHGFLRKMNEISIDRKEQVRDLYKERNMLICREEVAQQLFVALPHLRVL